MTKNYLPIILLQVAILSIGFGILVSAATAKYRDLVQALGFLVQIWMYLTPVVYPLSDPAIVLAGYTPGVSTTSLNRTVAAAPAPPGPAAASAASPPPPPLFHRKD